MHLLNTIRPSLYQKRVIAKVLSAATPKLAAAAIASDRNTISARDTLEKLGILSIVNDHVELTDRGMQLATDENIVDSGGSLTDVGTKLAAVGEQPAQVDQGSDAQGSADMATMPPEGMPTGDDLRLESFSLLRELLR